MVNAGRAFAQAVERDPKLKAGLKRAQARLRALALSPELREFCETDRQHRNALADALREHSGEFLADVHAELSAEGFKRLPHDLEGWIVLAHAIGIEDPSKLTAGDIYRRALAWCEQERVRAKIQRADPDKSALRVTYKDLEYLTRRMGRRIALRTMQDRKMSDSIDGGAGRAKMFLYSDVLRWWPTGDFGVELPPEHEAKEMLDRKRDERN